jgi:hypothetical protein
MMKNEEDKKRLVEVDALIRIKKEKEKEKKSNYIMNKWMI